MRLTPTPTRRTLLGARRLVSPGAHAAGPTFAGGLSGSLGLPGPGVAAADPGVSEGLQSSSESVTTTTGTSPSPDGDNDQASVIEVPRPTASRKHPTTKPVELYHPRAPVPTVRDPARSR